MIKAFIFDMDGTLVDSIEVHLSSAMRAYAEGGFPELADPEIYRKEVGKSFEDITRTIAKAHNIELSDDDIKKLSNLKRKFFFEEVDKVKLLPGAIELLSYLKDKGYLLALASSSARKEIDVILHKTGIDQFFRIIVSKEDVKRAKPSPDIFLKAAGLLGVKPEEAIVVEDSVQGVIAGKSGGFIVYAVSTGKDSKEALIQAGADKIFNNLLEILNYLIKLKK